MRPGALPVRVGLRRRIALFGPNRIERFEPPVAERQSGDAKSSNRGQIHSSFVTRCLPSLPRGADRGMAVGFIETAGRAAGK
jgi:hypothetical protein